MATESTVKNIRAPEAVFDRLKTLADESFPSQGAALEALLNSWEIQAAKGAIPNRETDISDFDSHVQAIQRAFIHSLEIAQNADARARDAFRQKVETLDKEKAELRQKLEEAEAKARLAETKAEKANAAALDANARADAAERHAATLEKALDGEKANAAAQIVDKEKPAHSLTAQVAELSERARENAAAIGQAENLRAQLAAAKRQLEDAQTAAAIADAKALADKTLAVSAACDEAATRLLQLTDENAALRVELERAKAKITLLESPKEMQTANATPMSDQQTPPAPVEDTSNVGIDKRRKAKARKTAPAPAPVAAEATPKPTKEE